MNHKYTIAALRELISVRRDSEQALTMCALAVGKGLLREHCERCAAECDAAIRELQGLIDTLEGEGEACAAVTRLWRSGWADLRAILSDPDEAAILDACERGESWMLEAYRNVLDDHLPDFMREAVLRQFEILMSTHDAIRACSVQCTLRGDGAAPGAQAGQH